MRKKKEKKYTKRERVEGWLMENQKILNITGLETKLQFPQGTIHKFIKYQRNITDRRIETIDEMIKDMAYSYIDEE
ncbi:hypothetical protein [Aquimarina muelleri]|uniref:Uncharacterized protein n=1 Tax=Aquimarina muelleri TaxID=279356 RepID=A0A918JX69_9FLAO|nr:hypothetical protein [Aquimarina muelleri]MCX2763716.1 hypothetical protein [Aquimarina muelleri]GGX30023.1 hypothetical protein GCM10007384_33990 [Aquimarina muelleri]